MNKPIELIDRDHEWETLQALTREERPIMGLLYGRRRVGKTFLLRHAWPIERTFYFTASETTSIFNRLELLRAMATWSGEEIHPEDYPTWRATFARLLELKGSAPLTIVLDEYQYIRGDDGDGVDSALNAVWETHLYRKQPKRNLILMLSGSAIGVMQKINSGARPLYGRFDWQRKLHPFDYRDTAAMVAVSDLRDSARYYGIYGGTPRYLSTVKPATLLSRNVARDVLAPDGRVRLQVESALEQESGLSDLPEHRAILAAVAEGHTTRNDIAQTVGATVDTTFRTRLDTLIELGYVAAVRNFEAAPNQQYHYTIEDPAIRFYYTFVLPYRHTLTDPSMVDAVWKNAIHPRLDTYMGHILESIAHQAYTRNWERDSLPMLKTWGRWEGQDRNRQSVEIDIVARASNGQMITGAIKWNSRPVTPALHWDHIEMLQRLSVSGYKWATDALAPNATFLYISASGFTDRWVDLSRSEERQMVGWGLEQLYNPKSPAAF